MVGRHCRRRSRHSRQDRSNRMGQRGRRSEGRHDQGRHALHLRVAMTKVMLACVVCSSIVIAACERESRSFHEDQVVAARADVATQTPLTAGGPVPPTGTQSPFQKNAVGVSDGKRLFSTYNCSGCHANGGGGIGPALMDDQWIYGYEARNIYETILEG